MIGVASSGVHSNGFSLVRKVLEKANANANTAYGDDQRSLIGDLLAPTTLYADLVQHLLQSGCELHGMAHITGGGLPENLPRCLPDGCSARIDASSWKRPPLFRWLQEAGDIPERDLWHTFNLGIGFCLVVPTGSEAAVLEHCRSKSHRAWVIGNVTSNTPGSTAVLDGVPA